MDSRDAARDSGSPPALSRLWSPGRARAVKFLARVFYPVAGRLRVTGSEHVPSQGKTILVFNHLSNFDVHLIFACLPREDVTGLVAADYRRRPLARLVVEAGGGIWLARRGDSRGGIRRALRLLERGWLVGIAPEGGRSRTGALSRARPGAAYLALRSGALVMPVALTGTESLHRSFPPFRRPSVTVRFGQPFRPLPLEGASRSERVKAVTGEIMGRLASLLPPGYRGVYSDHDPGSAHGHVSS